MGSLYEFGPFRLNPSERLLTRDGAALSLPPKVFDLLVVLIEDRGRLLGKDELLQLLWPGIFVEESNLSVNISTLRRALGEKPNEMAYVETVPKKGYRFVAEVVERASSKDPAPLASVPVPSPFQSAAPAPALAPTPSSAASVRRKWFAPALLVAILLVAGAIGLYRHSMGHPANAPAAGFHSIAVLPFRSLTASSPEDSLGMGMADALIMRLSNLGQLTVRPTTAIVKYAGAESDPLAAGRDLNVDVLLDGRIQRSGKKIRVSAQLIRVRDGASLWGATFDDYFTNIFAVQDSISQQLVQALSLKLSGEQLRALTKRHTESVEAYQLYLMGQYFEGKLSVADAARARDYFEQAIQKDPEYALAYTGLAAADITLTSGPNPEPIRAAAHDAVRKALVLDSGLAEAYLADGWVKLHLDWDWLGAAQAFHEAIARNPNLAQAHAGYSNVLTALDQGDDAVREMALALRIDPTSVILNSDYAWTLYCARQFEQSAAQSRHVLEMDAHSFFGHFHLGSAYSMQKKYPEAIAELKQAVDLAGPFNNGGPLAQLGRAYALSGDRTSAEATLADLTERNAKGTASHYAMALLYAALGDRDRAFQFLDRAYQARYNKLAWLRVQPEMDSLRSDPRFAELLKRLRLQ